ncbi:PAS domain-containing protein [Geomonas sp. RF6]|uniref:PAS domain-containing sensor histidine kinase n=1 Tax=Geomonas sp. RF6 TaxID=2897342 RepID=UPI001E5907A3|nr:PAS domain-containing sensor histidine kinase [Geomonas sp. RF6]UFS72251.1 PAS domain-containing protein [Geomonas sp. RF6]
MPRISVAQQRVLRGVAAVLMVAVASVVLVAFLKPIGVRHPFLVYYPVVALAAMYLEVEGGVTTTILSALFGAYFMEPQHALAVERVEDQVYVAVFVLEGLIITYAAERIRRARIAGAEDTVARERQRADENLKESEHRLRLALEGARMGMWIWDVTSDRSEWNDQEYELLGLPRGDGNEPTEHFFRQVHPDDKSRLNEALAEVLERGTYFSQDFRIVRPDGEVRWVAGRARLSRDREGKPVRMRGVNYDITSQKLMEEELRGREAEARARADEFALLMDTVPAFTFITRDPECRQMSGSKKSRQLLRIPEGRSVSASAPEEERPHSFRAMKDGRELAPEELPVQLAAKGKEVRDFEMTVVYNDGTSCDIFGDAVPLLDEAGNVRGAIGAFLDVTERKKMQQELQRAHDELEKRVEERTAELHEALESLTREIEERMQTVEALRERDQLLVHQSRLAAMGEMINNIAHQWRQPLNVISLIIQEMPLMYEQGEFTETYLHARVDQAKAVIAYMSQTIEDFRSFFRPSMEKAVFRVRDLLDKTLALVAETLEKCGIKVELEEIGEPSMYGYLSECSQVLLNILLNSRDAFLECRRETACVIRIRAVAAGSRTIVTIADNAGGIPEVIIGKIFEPYFTTKGPEKGTGIGLFMAKTIIEKHMNGSFTVRNIDGGAEFTIEVDSCPPAEALPDPGEEM